MGPVPDEGEERMNTRYYLHFSASGHWIISLNEISDVYKAVCHEETLMDCTVNKWSVLNTTMVEYEEIINENYTSSAAVIVVAILCLIFGFLLYRNNRMKKGVHGWQKDT